MLRLSTTLFRHRLPLLGAASSTACLAVGVHRSGTWKTSTLFPPTTQCASNEANEPGAILSSSSCVNSSDNSVIPTVQALNRARRLARTVALIVLDYQVSKVSSPSWWNPLFGTDEKDQSNEDEREYWQTEVANRKILLEQAQDEYTTESDSADRVEIALTKDEFLERKKKRKEEQKAKVRAAAEALGEAQEILATIGDGMDPVHVKAAQRLLDLCRENGGVYVKIGQHLANLDYLIPSEYITVLGALYDNAPVSSYESVREVVFEELGQYPEDVFESFDPNPIASASLAQVHVAIERGTGKKLAVKVQHRGLRETSVGDLKALETAVEIVDNMFTDFTWAWLSEEITPQLPLELDFRNEGRNAERASLHIQETGLECVVPGVVWDKTTSRVLSMDFEEGFKSTSITNIEEAGLDTRDVAKLISSVFNAQVFQSGFVHCDPHPANVLIREHPTKKGKPQMVLVDHGLYKQIDDGFRVTYAELWKSLMMADIKGIENASRKLGVGKMYPLLAGMLTTRPFDETIERSKSGSIDSAAKSAGDKAMIQGYAQRYIKEIFALLDVVPRQMLLLFKMNDCLRHVDFALGSPTNTLVIAGKYAVEAVYDHRWRSAANKLEYVLQWWNYAQVFMRIQAYELAVWWTGWSRSF